MARPKAKPAIVKAISDTEEKDSESDKENVIERIIPKLEVKGPNLVKGIKLDGLRVLGNPENFALHYYYWLSTSTITTACPTTIWTLTF